MRLFTEELQVKTQIAINWNDGGRRSFPPMTSATTWTQRGIVRMTYDRHRAAKLRLLNFLSLFRDLQKPTRFSGGGGGVVAEFFPDLKEPTWFSGGGVVAGFSRDLQMRNQIFTQHYVIFVGRDTHFA